MENIIYTLIALLTLILLRFLLELRLAHILIKYISWLPIRSITREKPISIKGNWHQSWTNEDASESFKEDSERTSNTLIKQFGQYCYAEFYSGDRVYVMFGRVSGTTLIGEWYDKEMESGYFGAFQLNIHDEKNMTGKWIGHSKKETLIRSNDWKWKRLI